VTKENQLQIGLLVCETVLEALMSTHPNKGELRRELTGRLAALQVSAMGEGSLGEQQEAQLKTAVAAFLAKLDR
jgi:hypothetical protein